MSDTFRDYWTRLFRPGAPSGVNPHNACVTVSVFETVRTERDALARALYDSQLEAVVSKRKIEDLERRLEVAQAKADSYSTMYAELRGRALPVSLLLVEGAQPQASAINAGLWELVRPEDVS